jgi:PKD repeat protein
LGQVVNTQPAAWTPQVRDGSVWAITQTGTTMVVGGEFTKVRAAKGGADLPRSNVFSFDASTGSIHGFSPVTDGRVSAVTPGKTPGTVYVAGSFKNLAGKAGRVFLLDAKTGAVLTTFTPAAIDGPIVDLALVGDRLYLGGSFTHVGGKPHAGVASLRADTGALDPYVNIQLQGHHNWTSTGGGTFGPTGTMAFDINPDGSTMAVVGNFKTVDGMDLDQAFLMDLTGSSARIADWQTNRFDPVCSLRWDTYMRDVKWSPDGKHFSIVTTGSGVDKTLCDTVSTWSGTDRGQGRSPVWVEATGGDSLYSLSHTDSAVYYGGHQRWGNNANGKDYANLGAVPRPGLAAADPNGLVPIDWNPARNPRGFGVTVMYATPTGLWMGSDTEWFGDFETFRPRLGFFPTAGGRPVARGTYSSLPAHLYRIDNTSVQRHYTNGTSIGAGESVSPGNLDGSTVRGAFMVDGTLFYGANDGYLYRRPVTSTGLGAATTIDPYNDPKWSTVKTGWQDQTYKGLAPQIYTQWKNGKIHGAEVRDNKLYYTKPGSNTVYRTGFSADSGIIAPFECYKCSTTAGDGVALSGSLTNPGDFVFFGNDIVYVNTANGNLMKAPFTPSGVGASTVLDSSRDYRGRGLFLGGGSVEPPANQPPSAAFTPSCTQLACSFDASASSDPDGSISSYAWTFGDGSTGTGPIATRTYTTAGTFTVQLTVTDNAGATATTSQPVSPTSGGGPAAGIEFVGSSGLNQNLLTGSVPLPQGVRAGDTVVLAVGSAVDAATLQIGGAGTWSQVGSYNLSNLWLRAYRATLTDSDLGKQVTLSLPSYGKVDVHLLAYRTSGGSPSVSGFQATATANPATITTPPVTVTASDAWAVHGWYSRSSDGTKITAPQGVAVRAAKTGTSSGHMTSLLADSGAPVPIGTLPGRTAVPDTVPPIGGAFTLLLTPQ